MTSRRAAPLKGVAEVPGDKSISHRALILGALSVGETRIRGLLEGDDVLAAIRIRDPQAPTHRGEMLISVEIVER